MIRKLTAIEGLRIAPAILTTQEGPDHHLGPEAAAAVLILQGSFADERGAAAFFLKAAELFQRLAVAPGFIRRFSFADGRRGYSIQLWRTPPTPTRSSPAMSTKRPCESSSNTAGPTATSPHCGR